MINTFIRCLVIYLLLLFALRLTGKRQIGELDLSEFITTLLISELASLPITDSDIPLLFGVLPIFILCCIEVILTFISSRHPTLRSAIAGKPSAIIINGKPNLEELSRLRIGANELIAQLRLQSVSDINTVKYAFFEENGNMSVFTDEDFSFVIIADGELNDFGLQQAKLTKREVENQLGNKAAADVFLMTYEKGKFTTILYKEEK